MRVANAKERFILDHAWRNDVLGLYAEGKAASTLAVNHHGKERLLGETVPGISFSRTGSHAVTAISNLADIGVDIEDCQPGQRWLSLAQTIDKRGWPAGCIGEAERACWLLLALSLQSASPFISSTAFCPLSQRVSAVAALPLLVH
jgi:hypothetical protein